MKKLHSTQTLQPERALLMALASSQEELEEIILPSLQELAALCESCQAEVVGIFTQIRPARNAAHYLGKGKIQEIVDFAKQQEADLLICDDELTGSQIRNLEQLTGLRVLDRSFLILDIFARRAHSHEGKLQVELAQHQYRMSRLSQSAEDFSRQGGGIGTRGPGETKLETNRRHIQQRIDTLKKELQAVAEHRERLRQHRKRSQTYSIAVVGYTNAGKSTLVNRLCKTDLYAKDQLFATLDASSRKLAYSYDELYTLYQQLNSQEQGTQLSQSEQMTQELEASQASPASEPSQAMSTTVTTEAEGLQDIHSASTPAYRPLPPHLLQPLMIDTVGFIRRLPHSLIHAFHSTLKEATDSNLVLHLLDASDPQVLHHFEVNSHLLEELHVQADKIVVVFNKIDQIQQPDSLHQLQAQIHQRLGLEQQAFYLSAKSGEGVEALRQYILCRCLQASE